jgi:phage terminase large subunit
MEIEDIRFELLLQPKQVAVYKEYESSEATIIGFGGARGGAKSHIGRAIMIARRWKYENTWGMILRKTIDDLRDNHIRPMLREYPYLGEWYNKMEKVITFPNGSLIRFISSDNYDDIFKMYGKEFADIFVDQAEQFTQEQLEFLTTINRCATNTEITPKMLLTFNAGGVGHSYLKRIFIKKEYQSNEKPERFSFLRAYGWDNVEWMRKYLEENKKNEKWYYSLTDEQRYELFVTKSDYGVKLNELPENQRKAQLLGDFDVFEGQFFQDFRRDIHVLDSYNLKKEFNIYGAIDYGRRTVLELAQVDYNGVVVFFDEVYTEDMSPQERANMIADKLISYNLSNLDLVVDSNMVADMSHYTGYDKTPFDIFQETFLLKMGKDAPIMRIVSKYSTDKKGYRCVCNEAFRNYLSWKKDENGSFIKRPKVYFTRNCRELINTLPELIQDPNSNEGLDFDQRATPDDAYDAAKYLLMEVQSSNKPKEPKTYITHKEYMYDKVFQPIIERSITPRVSADCI